MIPARMILETGPADHAAITTDAELAAAWQAGTITLAEAEVIGGRRGGRERARRAAAAFHAREGREYRDALEAAVRAAGEACAGRLFSRDGMADGPGEDAGLWTCTARQAQRWASEELRNWWLDHGRLTLAEYRAGLAASRRAARADRDAGRAEERRIAEAAAWEHVPGGRVRPTWVNAGGRRVRAWWAVDQRGHASLHPTRASATATPGVPASGPERPVDTPAADLPGGGYTAAMGAATALVSAFTAHVTAARGHLRGRGAA